MRKSFEITYIDLSVFDHTENTASVGDIVLIDSDFASVEKYSAESTEYVAPEELTVTLRFVLETIINHYRKTGRLLKTRELCGLTGYKSTFTVHRKIHQLIDLGYLEPADKHHTFCYRVGEKLKGAGNVARS